MKDFYEGLSPEDLERVKAMEVEMQLASPDHPSIRNSMTVVMPITRRRNSPSFDAGDEDAPESKR